MLFRDYPSRAVLGASLMITQSFLYNAIFFTYTLVLSKFYGVPSTSAPVFLIAFAVGNLAGPLTIGHLFDTIGRRKMIAGTYVLSGLLLAITAFLFNAGVLNAVTQTIAWCIIFYFASAGASAAYLTVSEIFPLEVRSKAIAVFFAIAQCFGAIAPAIYGALIGDGSQPIKLFFGYLLGAVIMITGGVVAFFLAVDAEGRSLEDIASPLAARRTGSTRAEGSAQPVTRAEPPQPPVTDSPRGTSGGGGHTLAGAVAHALGRAAHGRDGHRSRPRPAAPGDGRPAVDRARPRTGDRAAAAHRRAAHRGDHGGGTGDGQQHRGQRDRRSTASG